jgi:rhodanese-related sulfurtransferase
MRWALHGLLAVFLLAGAGAASAADGDILTAKQAYDKTEAGQVLLVDVRRPEEWRQTGLPDGGVPETIHREGGLPAFAKALLARLGDDKSKPIALICARGGRSAYTREFLIKEGFTNVVDVSKGMIGGHRGPGWKQSGLPTQTWQPE